MKKTLIASVLLTTLLLSGCITPTEQNKTSNVTNETQITEEKGINLSSPPEKTELSSFYSEVETEVVPSTAQYELPLNKNEIGNYQNFSKKISLSEEEEQTLLENGFVVLETRTEENKITGPYDSLKQKGVPIFITTDSLLHLYHIQFDETLRRIEEEKFYPMAWNMSEEMVEHSKKVYESSDGELKEAAKKNLAFYSTALELLEPEQDQVCEEGDEKCLWKEKKFSPEEAEKYSFQVPEEVKEEVNQELELIKAHQGFNKSPLFTYKEDYSQYVPRGHYTRSERLKNYFKGFMWFGRMTFLLKGGCKKCLVTEEEARIQTKSAAITATHFSNNKELAKDWNKIYEVTSFYVGLSDDLEPYEYLEAMNKVFGNQVDLGEIEGKDIGELKAELASYRNPKIYGGTGDCVINPPFNPEQADECLEATKGMRFMGQRFVPDSYMFSQLVFPRVGGFTGEKSSAFTESGGVRVFPRGLDVMSLLGSERAGYWLEELQDNSYDGYNEQHDSLEKEFSSFSEKEWNKNLYWAWLYSLKPLLKDFDEGYPTFMQTSAWKDKELNTALASWTELRHDTILYAKQSYTMRVGAAIPPQPEKVVGYTEPTPEFYSRLLSLTKMTRTGLNEMEVLDETSESRLESMETILERLKDISEKELRNKELSEEDYNFINNFDEALEGTIRDVDEKAQKTTIVADVHTDSNTGQVLEEGVGYVKIMAVAYKLPNGDVLVGAGPVLSHYEFKQPMRNRLTDEKWRETLRQEKAPGTPAWHPG